MNYLTEQTPVTTMQGEEAGPDRPDGLAALTDRALLPLSWRAERLEVESAWWQHVPFAHWLVGVTVPRLLVELGTHSGVSYAAFCNAVTGAGLGTRCYAVDTWKGDAQAGMYGEEVFEDLRRFHDDRYTSFSTLLRSTFDEAVDKFPDGSIDLLHIDGYHTYEAVRHDFETWKPKLSDRAVVLFHDTNEHGGDFGVWRFWGELRERYPSFEFLNGHGLGVLAVGPAAPPAVASLCALKDPAGLAAFRGLFARLGERWWYEGRERIVGAQSHRHAVAAAAAEARERQALAAGQAAEERERQARAAGQATEERERQARAAWHQAETARLGAEERARLAEAATESARQEAAGHAAVAGAAVAERARIEAQQRLAEERALRAEADADAARREAAAHAAVAGAVVAERMRVEEQRRLAEEWGRTAEEHARRVEAALEDAWRHVAARTDEGARFQDEIARLQEVLRETDSVLEATRRERDALLYSATWRATRPLRTVAGRLPSPVRRSARRALRAAYWTATFQLPRRLGEWRTWRKARTLAVSHDSAVAHEAERVPSLPSPEPVSPESWGAFDRTPAAPEVAEVQSQPTGPVAEQPYDRWVREYDTLSDDDRTLIRGHVARLAHRPLISVVMPAHDTPERLLREAIASVRAQLYPYWELCVADDASPLPHVAEVLREAAAEDPRIKWMRRDSNGHIAAATNSALSLASGEFVAFMDHDDLLAEQALYEVAVELDAHPDADLIYSDEDRVDADGRRHSPYFKTDWNPDLLLGHNMVNHLGVYRRSLLAEVGGLREGMDGSQDYDLVLRVSGATSPARIRHVPAVLYHWREMDGAASFSQSQLDRCVAAARRAIREHLDNATGPAPRAEVLPAHAVPFWTRVRWPLPDPAPRVSLIVPTRDRADLLARCAAGLLHRTDYPDLELLIVDNDSREPETLALFKRLQEDRRVRVVPFPGPFNYSEMNNAAVREATGSVVVLVNNDIDVIGAEWLREMVSLAVRPDVGAVGAKLLYADGTIQHAGVVLGIGSFAGGPGVAGHFGLQAPRDEVGYFGQYVLAREVSAATGACAAMRKEVFEAAGGLDADHLPVAFNDVDLCLRIRESGLRIVWTPFAELYHLESASRGSDAVPEKAERVRRECTYMRDRWGPLLDTDPFYNPHFSRADGLFHLAFPPRREKPWRRGS